MGEEEVCGGVLDSGIERNVLKRDHECIEDENKDEPCTKKLASEAKVDVKEASNDDIRSEVSNPNDTCSLQAISSTQKPELISNKLEGSDEESLSEENLSKNDETIKVPLTGFVREIPDHISSCGIRKITFKFSKSREEYENKSVRDGVFASSQYVSNGKVEENDFNNIRTFGDGAFASSQYVSNVKVEANDYNIIRTERSCNTFSYRRKRENDKSAKIFGETHLTNVKKLLSSGVLEGARVKYVTTRKTELYGIIRDWGYACSCSSCNYSRILTAYEFEVHAGGSTKHPNNHIFLENGKPIYAIIQQLKTAPLSMVDEVIKNVAGSAVNEELFKAWRARIKRKTEIVKAETYGGRQWTTEVKKPICRPFTHYPTSSSYKKNSTWGSRKRDNDLHRVLFIPGGLPDGAELAYYARGHKVLYGYKLGNGIVCSCCDTEVSPSQFEAHAGWSVRRQPYRNIYTSSGLTLHDIALSLSSGQKLTTGSSDDMCAVCGDGGDLVICDGCPRSFHAICLNLDCAPNGDWYCPCCRDSVGLETFGESSSMERPIAIRMTRVVKAPEIETGGCVVCRASDFSAGKFDDRTVMLCDQCEREYHVGCLRNQGLADLKELPTEKWFCCDECTQINVRLQNTVLIGAEAIPVPALNIIDRKYIQNGLGSAPVDDVRWQILSGKSRASDHLRILSTAASIFRECFDPIKASSGRDLIPVMVYARNISGQEFGGMYCVVLIVNSVVVSAGLLRILGRDAAELPLVATSREHQGKGYFQALFSCIEGLLYSLNVENVVLPAAEVAESIWTNKLGFKKMSNERFMKYIREFQLTSFKGTSMLEKPVQQQIAE